MCQTILMIEDDPEVTAVLTAVMEDAGFRVLTASDGTSGLATACSEAPDLVLLALGLPDMHGSEVARCLRRTGPVPIVVLTANISLASKARLLEAGATEYLTKPFSPEQVVSRVQLQLRKHQRTGELRVGPLLLSFDRQVCVCGGREVRLLPKEFRLLALLVQDAGRVYSRARIVDEVWSGVAGGRNRVDVQITNLRSRLREVGASEVVRTVWGEGYVFHNPENEVAQGREDQK